MKKKLFIKNNARDFNLALFFISLFITFLLLFLRLYLGSISIKLDNIFKLMYYNILKVFNNSSIQKIDKINYIIIYKIRLPKFLLSFLTGGILAINGVILQNILRNPLADPFTLGISSGAAAGAVICIFLAFNFNLLFLMNQIWIFAISGAFLSVFIVFIISYKSKFINTNILILAGVIVNTFFSAIITFFISLLSSRSYIALSYMMGYISSETSINLNLLYIIEIFLFLIILLFYKELNILNIGTEFSLNLGINVKKIKLFILILSTISTALIVSQTGIIGFVGIIIPHILRNLISAKFENLAIFSFIWGGNFLVFSNILSEKIPSLLGFSSELQIGVVTALIGAPIFIYLLFNKNKNFLFN